MTSRNFGHFLTPHRNAFHYQRLSTVVTKSITPSPPKTVTSFADDNLTLNFSLRQMSFFPERNGESIFLQKVYFSGNPFMFLLKIALTSDHSLTFRQEENISFPNEYEFGFSILPPTRKKVAFLFLLLKGFQIRETATSSPNFSLNSYHFFKLVSCRFSKICGSLLTLFKI